MTTQDLIDQLPDGPTKKRIRLYWIVASVSVTFVSAIFGAGVGYQIFKTKYLDKIIEDGEKIKQLNAGLQDISNDVSFKNTLTSNGPGHDASVSPGRCPKNEVVVGLQPWANGFVMQCGKMPVATQP